MMNLEDDFLQGVLRPQGFSGRPSGGNRALGNLGDISIEYRPASKTTLYFYYGFAGGRRVIQSVYPAGSAASLVYGEITQRF